MAQLEDAVWRFVSGQEPAAGYAYGEIGSHRALCLAGAMEGAREDVPAPVLLRGEDGAVYLPEPASESVAAALHKRRFRPTSSTLMLRLPAEIGGRTARFTLWALPAYLSQTSAEGPIWK